nr:hypothetical protein Iba_chr03aCG21510 [Ipomoea batatas]GMC73100.1 hypothetical protein Iba_chr03bCG17800 [Ipomoea batatas]GMC75954.1 hypothetical protein Iba_chr03dCG9740 [Ipomoea batatas]
MPVARGRIPQVITMYLWVTLALKLLMLCYLPASQLTIAVLMQGSCGIRTLGVLEVMDLFLSEMSRMLNAPLMI